MMQLVKRRDFVISAAKELIDLANGEFDDAVVPLAREISELRERLKKPEVIADKKKTKQMLDLSEALDENEQAHYRELLKKRRKR